ncbi:MAG: hypothetical protein RIS45_1574 [Planctomycetota bacterium]
MMRSLPYYVTEKQLAEKLGMTLREWEAVRPLYEKSGMPLRDPLCGRRYLAAVELFLDRHNHLNAASDAPQIVENLDAFHSPRTRRRDRPVSPAA